MGIIQSIRRKPPGRACSAKAPRVWLQAMALMLVTVFAGLPDAAHAHHGHIQFCNGLKKTRMSIGFAYKRALGILLDRWNVHGWYNIEPQQCRTIFSGASARYHMYLHVELEQIATGKKNWTRSPGWTADWRFDVSRSKSQGICVERDRFGYTGSAAEIQNCDSGQEFRSAQLYVIAKTISEDEGDLVSRIWIR